MLKLFLTVFVLVFISDTHAQSKIVQDFIRSVEFASGDSAKEILKEVIINVKRPPFNAKGDGVTDDTFALQAALSFKINEKRKLIVNIPPGTYLISDTLKVHSNTEIVGASQPLTSIRQRRVISSSSKNIILKDMLSLDQVKNIVIRNLLIDGGLSKEILSSQRQMYQAALVPGPTIPNCQLAPLLNCRSINRFSGVRIFQSSLITGENPNTSEIPDLAVIRRLENITLENVSCRGTVSSEVQPNGIIQACIVVENAYNVTLNKLSVFENVGSGLLLWNGQRIKVTGGKFFDNVKGSGITGGGFSNILIKDNIAYNNSYTNISVNGVNSLIEGNTSYESGIHGVTLGHAQEHSRADNVILRGNIIHSNRIAGICLTNAANAVVTDNTVTDNLNEGILLFWKSEVSNINAGNVLIQNNRIANNNFYGIRMTWGHDNQIVGNIFVDNGKEDIWINGENGKPVSDVIIADNEFINQFGAKDDVTISNTTGVQCLNNTLRNETSSIPLGFTAKSSHVIVSGNNFYNYSNPSRYKTEGTGSFQFNFSPTHVNANQ